MSHHAVASSQVPVHELLGIQVRHAIGDLRCHLNHLLQGRGRAARVILQWKHGLTVSDPGTHSEEQRPARVLEAAHLSLRPQRAEVALQVSVSHQLHHHQRGLALGHHPQEADLQVSRGFSGEGPRDDFNPPWSLHLVPVAHSAPCARMQHGQPRVGSRQTHQGRAHPSHVPSTLAMLQVTKGYKEARKKEETEDSTW